MTTAPVAILASGLFIFLISLPLIYRKVPMNHFYGIRIQASFESDQRWYDINAYGGRQIAAWSWLITITGILGCLVPHEHLLAYVVTSIPVMFVAVLIPTVRVFLWSRKH